MQSRLYFIQAMLRVHGGIKRIPNNMENYISFSLGNLRFIHSVNFLLSSLDYLAKCSDPNSFKMLQRRGTYRSSLAVCRIFSFSFMSSTSLSIINRHPSAAVYYQYHCVIFSLDMSPSTMAIFQHRVPNVVSILSNLLSFIDIS